MSDNQIEEVKRNTDIVAIIGERIELKKAGRNYKANCPFHGEKTPSFMVSPELQIFKCFGCFPAGQSVKTPFGYKNIEDISANEWIVSGKGNFQKVQTSLVRNYNGDLIHINLLNLNEEILMTGDHNVFIVGGAPLYKFNYKYLSKRLNGYLEYPHGKYLSKIHKYFPIQKIQARNIKKGMTMLYPIDSRVTNVPRMDLSEYITKKWPVHGKKPLIPELNIEIDDNFLKLIGYYIAEGSSHRAYVRFSIGDHERKFAKDIVTTAKKVFDLDAKICRKHGFGKTGTEISLCNSILSNIFENLCGKGADNKQIPLILQQIDPIKQMVILNAIFRGDGFERLTTKSKTKRREITTVSQTLAGQLVDVLLRNGFYPSRYLQRQKIDKDGINHKKAYTVSWSVDPHKSKHNHVYEDKDGSKYWLLRVGQKKDTSYIGKVYNLRVTEDHSYVVNTCSVSNCGEAGDVFAFLEKYEGMEFPEALKYLADRAGIKLQKFQGGDGTEKERLIALNHEALRYYNYLLLEHPVAKKALEYLIDKRGLTKETIEEFKLGYSPESSYSLKSFLVDKKKFTPAEIEKAGIGIVRGSSLYDRFNGRVIFPLYDHRGNPIGFSGRILPWDKRETGKYINSPETPLYHKSNVLFGLNLTRSFIKKKKVAIVVEGELDLISSWQAGIKNVVAIKGSALTEEQVRLLSRFAEKFILALDSDMAGDAATRRGIKIASDMGVEIKVAEISGGYKDPDDAARGNLDSYKKDLIGAKVIWDFLIDSVLARNDAGTGSGKSKISKEITPILSEISDKIVRAHYANVVAKKLGVSLEAVSEEIDRNEKPSTPSAAVTEVQEEAERTKRDVLEENFLKLVFAQDPKILLSKKVKEIIKVPFNLKLIDEYAKFASKKEFTILDFGNTLPKELFEGFSKIVLIEERDLDENAEELKKELELVKKELRILAVKEKLEILQSKIREMEDIGEEDKLLEAQNEFNKLVKLRSTYEKDDESGIILNEP